MLALLKLIQSLIKTLHSAGTPGQVAAGMALGSALGLTPLLSLHNLVVFSLLVQTEATQRIQAEKQRLGGVKKQLNAQLQRMTRGLAPGIELPKIKL